VIVATAMGFDLDLHEKPDRRDFGTVLITLIPAIQFSG